MDKKPSLIGASLRSVLSTIDVICESYGNHIGSLPESDSKSMSTLLSQIEVKITDLSSKLNMNKEKYPTQTNNDVISAPNNSQQEQFELQTDLVNSSVASRRHTISSDDCTNSDGINLLGSEDGKGSTDSKGNLNDLESNIVESTPARSDKEEIEYGSQHCETPYRRRLSVPLISEKETYFQNNPVRGVS